MTQQLPASHRHYHTVEKALRFIQLRQQAQPTLVEIAAHCAMSEYHFHKVFSEWAGVSPKRFLQYLTREQCRARLLDGDSLLDSSAAAGLSGGSRLHDLLVTLEAVTPGELRSRGEGLEMVYGIHSSPFGECFIAVTRRGIHRLAFIDDTQGTAQVEALAADWPRARLQHDPTQTLPIMQRIFPPDRSVPRDRQPLKLWLQGSRFQFKVWEALLRVPAGRVCSYGELAQGIGQPGAARAVGSAVANNPVALLIPCHRVIRNMGITGDYRWGALRKQALLGWEAGYSEAACD